MTVTELPQPAAPPADDATTADSCPRVPTLPEGGPEWLSIAEVADQTGISAHTLRYYERVGLLDVPRDHAGRRRYTEDELARVVFISWMRLTAMPIRHIQAYFRLVEEGPGNEAERLALLERHRDQVKVRLAALQAALDVIDIKIATYGGMCEPTS